MLRKRGNCLHTGQSPGGRTTNEQGKIQTAYLRALLSIGITGARFFFGKNAPTDISQLHNKSPPDVLHFKKNYEMENIFMSEWIRIRIKDFYKDAIGEMEYTYVSREVYEALTNTFRKEAHAEEMRDLRHVTANGYTEGDTEDLMMDTRESLEDMVIRQMELEVLQKAMQSLTEVQRERLHLYFFSGLTFRQIGEKLGVSDMSVRESIDASLKKIKKFFD